MQLIRELLGESGRFTFGAKYWNNNNLNDYEKLFDKLVPDSGQCETVEGEMLRAATRIYRDYFNNGFGANNWSGALNFLWTIPKDFQLHPPIFHVLEPFSTGGPEPESDAQAKVVEHVLDEMMDAVLKHIHSKNGEYTPNDVDMFSLDDEDYKPSEEDYDDEWEEDINHDEDDGELNREL